MSNKTHNKIISWYSKYKNMSSKYNMCQIIQYVKKLLG